MTQGSISREYQSTRTIKSYSTSLVVSFVRLSTLILTLNVWLMGTYLIYDVLHQISLFSTKSFRHLILTILFTGGLTWHCSTFSYLYMSQVFCSPVLEALKAVVSGFLHEGHLRIFLACSGRFLGRVCSPLKSSQGSSMPIRLINISQVFSIWCLVSCSESSWFFLQGFLDPVVQLDDWFSQSTMVDTSLNSPCVALQIFSQLPRNDADNLFKASISSSVFSVDTSISLVVQ